MTLSTDFSNKSIDKMYVMHIVAQITEAGIFGITVDIKTNNMQPVSVTDEPATGGTSVLCHWVIPASGR